MSKPCARRRWLGPGRRTRPLPRGSWGWRKHNAPRGGGPRVAWAERLPRIEVAGDYGVNGPTAPHAIATRDLTLQVSVPILDGFHREARLDEQDAVVRESQVREADLRRQIAAEVDAALLDLGSAEAQQLVAREELRLAESELSQARERFKAGGAGNIDGITAPAGPGPAPATPNDAPLSAATPPRSP